MVGPNSGTGTRVRRAHQVREALPRTPPGASPLRPQPGIFSLTETGLLMEAATAGSGFSGPDLSPDSTATRPVAVGDPGELPAEAILAERHQFGPAVRERGREPRDFILRLAVHEKRDGRRKAEACFTKLSVHITTWPPTEKVAFITDPRRPQRLRRSAPCR